MPFKIIREDITKVSADAIVNTANPLPVYADGTDSAIYKAAGEKKLLAERKKIGKIGIGEVAVTPAFELSAEYIIHTVGPSWSGGNQGEYDQLASCYRKSLLIANQLGCKSIAFPLISTGIYGFPKDRALDIALKTFRDFLNENEMDITLVVFDKNAFELSRTFTENVKQYIDDNYVYHRSREEYSYSRNTVKQDMQKDLPPVIKWFGRKRKPKKPSTELEDFTEEDLSSDKAAMPTTCDGLASPSMRPLKSKEKKAARAPKSEKNLSEVIKDIDESFQERLFRIIFEKGLTDTEVYKKANLDRKLFSKIRCNPNYVPKKQTAIALAIALELNLEETIDLLERAGYALSPSSISDLILRFCIENQMYDIFEINALLFKYNQKCLG